MDWNRTRRTRNTLLGNYDVGLEFQDLVAKNLDLLLLDALRALPVSLL